MGTALSGHDENALDLTGKGVQPCAYTRNYSLVHFEWVNGMVCEL